MKSCFSALCMVLFFSTCAMGSGRPTLFLGIAGGNAPAIEKNLDRLFEEQLASMPDIRFLNDDEVQRLRSRMESRHYPTITTSLAAAIKKCGVPDSALIIWAMVKSCSVEPSRRLFFKAVIKASLTLEMAVYSLNTHAYAYIGEAEATAEKDKGFIFWLGPVKQAVHVSALDRSALLDRLQKDAVNDAGRIFQAILFYEKMSGRREARLPEKIEKKSITVAPSPAGDASPYDEEPAGPDSTDADTGSSAPADTGTR